MISSPKNLRFVKAGLISGRAGFRSTSSMASVSIPHAMLKLDSGIPSYLRSLRSHITQVFHTSSSSARSQIPTLKMSHHLWQNRALRAHSTSHSKRFLKIMLQSQAAQQRSPISSTLMISTQHRPPAPITCAHSWAITIWVVSVTSCKR